MTSTFDIESPEESIGIRSFEGKRNSLEMSNRPSSLKAIGIVLIIFEVISFIGLSILVIIDYDIIMLGFIPFGIYGIVLVPIHVTIAFKQMRGSSFDGLIFHFIVLSLGAFIATILLWILGFIFYHPNAFAPSLIFYSFRVLVLIFLCIYGAQLRKNGYMRTFQDYFYYMKDHANNNNEISIKQLAAEFHRPVDKVIKKFDGWNKKMFFGIVDASTLTLQLNSQPIHTTTEYCDYIRSAASKTGEVSIIALSKMFSRNPDVIIRKLGTWIKKGYLAGNIDKTKGVYVFGGASIAKTSEAGNASSIEIKPTATPLISNQTMKTRLFGMIKTMKKIDINQASSLLGMNKQELQGLLFELAGEDKIIGEFQDENTFIITSGVDEFISALDSQFDNWREREQSEQGKI